MEALALSPLPMEYCCQAVIIEQIIEGKGGRRTQTNGMSRALVNVKGKLVLLSFCALEAQLIKSSGIAPRKTDSQIACGSVNFRVVLASDVPAARRRNPFLVLSRLVKVCASTEGKYNYLLYRLEETVP